MARQRRAAQSSGPATSSVRSKAGSVGDAEYSAFLSRVQARFRNMLLTGTDLLFQTVPGVSLWNTYLDSFLASHRQHYNCHCCHEFIKKYGGLVVVSPDGQILPAIWHEDDAWSTDQEQAIRALYRVVSKARINCPFYSDLDIWGNPEAGGWNHLSVIPPREIVHNDRMLTAEQKMATKKEDFKNLGNAMQDYSIQHVRQALAILESDSLFQGDSMVDRAKFLIQAIESRNQIPLIWRMVATAPVGFCNIRGGMLGTLIEDCRSGYGLETIKRKFNEKMHPLQYRRPQAAPAAQNVKRAEEIFQKLNLASALERRVARTDELRPVWSSSQARRLSSASPAATGTSIFGHLPTKDTVPVSPGRVLSADGEVEITWTRFRDEVLPKAQKIEVRLEAGRLHWIVFTTAVHPEAEQIISWDRPEDRNPMAWYCWNGGADASQYGLTARNWHDVTAVSLLPNTWTSPAEERRVAFVVDRARETRHAGAALFPAFLRSDLNEVRSTIESYSGRAKMQSLEQGSACAICFSESSRDHRFPVKLRVTTENMQSVYVIDRWN